MNIITSSQANACFAAALSLWGGMYAWPADGRVSSDGLRDRVTKRYFNLPGFAL